MEQALFVSSALNVIFVGIIFIMYRGAKKLYTETRMLKGFSGAVLSFAEERTSLSSEELSIEFNKFMERETQGEK